MVLSLSWVSRFKYGGMGSSPCASNSCAKERLGLSQVKCTSWVLPEVESLSEVLKPQDLYSLVFCDRISDIDLYKQYYRKGYDYQTSVTLTNDLNAQYSRTLMELPLMEYKEVMAYMEYAAKGYSPQFAAYFYNNYEPEDFIAFRNIAYFPAFEGLLQEEGLGILHPLPAAGHFLWSQSAPIDHRRALQVLHPG